jgi:hypothetical protein
MVLAGGGDPEAPAPLPPPAPAPGVEREASLIGEGDGVLGAEYLEFFFAGAGMRAPRWLGPGGRWSRPA